MDEFTSILEMSNDKLANSRHDKLILEPFDYICKTPCRQIPLKFFRALNYWFDIPFAKFSLIIEIVDELQNASILLDDIEDHSTTRQGLPVAHMIYGVPSTLNAATYVFCVIPEKIQLLGHPEAMQVYIEEMREIHRGQGLDIYWRDNFKSPTYLEYKLMALQKLGSIFRFGARLIQLLSTKTIDISRLIVIIGIYFQIWDDHHSISDDITEGKFGFPMVHAVQSEKNSGKVLSVLKQRTADVEVVKDCIRHMQTLGSLQYSYDALISLGKEAREEVTKLGSNPLMDKLLREFGSPQAAIELVID